MGLKSGHHFNSSFSFVYRDEITSGSKKMFGITATVGANIKVHNNIDKSNCFSFFRK